MTKQSATAAVAVVSAPVTEKAAVGGRGVEATTEEQARAIICAAKRAVEEAAKIRGAGGGEKPSLKRSLECFLEGRKKKATSPDASRRRRLESSPAAAAASSSSGHPST